MSEQLKSLNSVLADVEIDLLHGVRKMQENEYPDGSEAEIDDELDDEDEEIDGDMIDQDAEDDEDEEDDDDEDD